MSNLQLKRDRQDILSKKKQGIYHFITYIKTITEWKSKPKLLESNNLGGEEKGRENRIYTPLTKPLFCDSDYETSIIIKQNYI